MKGSASEPESRSWSLWVLANPEGGSGWSGRERSEEIDVPVLVPRLGRHEADRIDLKPRGDQSVRRGRHDQPARLAPEHAGRTGWRAGQDQGQDLVRAL